MSRRASLAQLSSQQEDWTELKSILADNRSNIQAVQNPENAEKFRYLRPSSVGAFAAGTGLLEVPEQLDGQEERVFIPDPKDGFSVATVIKRDPEDETIFVKNSRGKDVHVKLLDAVDVNPRMFDYCENMARLTNLNEASILHNLRLRYKLNLIHTYSGLFCITINPWRWLPLYSDDISLLYKGQPYAQMPPHVYAVADNCYNNMLQGQANQSILITGESGAGKTENTKKIINYFTTVAHCPGRSSLEQQIVATNPVLEAFGNAKTVYNDNSSRFGKFIRVYFKTSDAKVYGADVESYLLEKSRVICQGPGERSFHIFYMLLSTGSKDIRDELQLEGTAGDYRFLANGVDSVASIDDEVEMSKLERSLDMLGFSEDERISLFKMTAAVVLLGQMKFSERSAGDQAYICGMDEPRKVAGLLGLSPHDLVDLLTEPTVKIGDEVIRQSRSLAQVMFSVNAVAKTMYEKIFISLVKKLNESIAADQSSVGKFDSMLFIGLLDVAGFEIFMLNSFEQLCINYTNERLQQFFNHRMFVLEQEIYLEEGIPWNTEDFGESLEPTINLIDKPMGIMSLLEEECMVPRGNDKGFLEKLDQNHSAKSPAYSKAKPSRKTGSNAHFTINHYAATVNYNADGWIDKNKDPMNECMIQLFRNSNYKHVADLWKNGDGNRFNETGMSTLEVVASASNQGRRPSVAAGNKSMSFMTVSNVYREQLNNLLDVLDETEPHFIRCIVPNYEKKPGHIDGPLVLHQLKCNGVLEGIRICRQGFPNRVPYEECSNRFGILASDIIQWNDDPHTACEKIVKVKGLKVHDHVEFGKTKLFCRAGILGKLEKWRTDRIQELVIMLQSEIRAYLAQVEGANRIFLKDAQCVIQANIRHWTKYVTWDWYRLLVKVRPLMVKASAEQQEEIDKMKETQNTLKEELDNVASEKKTLKRRTSILQDAMSEVETKKLALENELEALKAKSIKEKADYQNEIQRLKNELKLLKRQLEDLKDSQNQEDERLRNLKAKNSEMETTIEQLRHALDRERLAREEIEQCNGRASKDVEDLRRTLSDILMEKQKLEGIQEIVSNRSSHLENQVADLRDKCERLMKLIKELEKRIEELQDLLHDEKQHRRKVERSCSILQDENQNCNDKIARLEKTISNQTDLLKDGASENRRLEKLLQETETKMQFELGELRRRHKTSMDAMQEQVETQHKKALKLESDNQSMKAQLEHENRLTQIDSTVRGQHLDRNSHTMPRNMSPAARIMRSASQMGDKGMHMNGRSNSVCEYGAPTLKNYYSEYSSPLHHRKSLEDELMKKVEDLQKQLRNADREKRLVKRQHEQVKENLDEETMAKDSIQKQLKIGTLEMHRVEALLKNEEYKNYDLQHQVQKMHCELNTWKTKFEEQLVDKDSALDYERQRLLEKLKSASEDTETASNRVTMLGHHHSELQSELAETQQELNRALRTIATDENLHRTQEKAYEHLCEQYEMIVKEVDQMRVENSDLKLKIHHIERRNLIEDGLSSMSSSEVYLRGDPELEQRLDISLAENTQLNQELQRMREASVQLIENFSNELQNVKEQLKQQDQDKQSQPQLIPPEVQLQLNILNEKMEEVTTEAEKSKRTQQLLETELQLGKEIIEGKDKTIYELKMASQEYKACHTEIQEQAHAHAKNAAELADRLHRLQKENAKMEDLLQEQETILTNGHGPITNGKSHMVNGFETPPKSNDVEDDEYLDDNLKEVQERLRKMEKIIQI